MKENGRTELNEKELAEVIGGSDGPGEMGDFFEGEWVKKREEPDLIFHVLHVRVTNGLDYGVYFARYWHDQTQNKAWNFGTITECTNSKGVFPGTYYQVSAPSIDTTFTGEKPF